MPSTEINCQREKDFAKYGYRRPRINDELLNDRDGNKLRVPARYIMACMSCCAVACINGFKANVGVAILAMVNYTAITSNAEVSVPDESITPSNHNGSGKYYPNVTRRIETQDGPFAWDESVQGLILSSYFWGFMVLQPFAGRAAELYSARWVVNVAVSVNGVFAVLTPALAPIHYSLFMALRILQGVAGGLLYPAVHVLLANWSPPEERASLSSIVYGGAGVGVAISSLLSGFLATNSGWQSVFYIQGGLSLVWCVAWWLWIEETPEQQTMFITRHEREYIARSLKSTKDKEKLAIPWADILRSMPAWAILVSHTCNNFGWYMLLTELPTYMSQILKFDLNQTAGLAAIPYIGLTLVTIVSGQLLTIFVSKGWITATASKKIAGFIASMIPMSCLLGVTYVGRDTRLAVVLMVIAVAAIGSAPSGFFSNHIDIAPNFAGTLMSITNTIAAIPGLLATIFVGQMTRGKNTIEAWRSIFFVTAGFYVMDFGFYMIFGTARVQAWNQSKVREKEPEARSEEGDAVLSLKNNDVVK